MAIGQSRIYNRVMKSNSIESLLEAANSSPTPNTSVNFAKRVFLDDEECRRFFATVRAKLFRVDEWTKNSSASDYALFEETGEECGDPILSVGRFIRINLYGGGKYDWVRVISIADVPNEVVLTVKPSFDPTQPPVDAAKISHFFGPEATNNFCLQRHEKTLAFYVIGLNENQNTAFTDGLVESARNAAVANIGYFSGLQKAVWKEFCKKFISIDEKEDG